MPRSDDAGAVRGSAMVCSMPGISDELAYLFGSELRGLRERAGLSQKRMANGVGMTTHTVVWRWERGERIPSAQIVDKIADVLDVTAVERDRLTNLAREAADQSVNEVSAGSTGQADALTTLIRLERVATGVTDVSIVLVPGLLQTPEYARIVLGHAPNVDTKVAARVGRREILTRDRSPVQYTAYLLEGVLHQQTGQDVMRDQLRLIRDLAGRSNVTIRIIPEARGITRAHTGSFVLMEFAAAEPIVHLEDLSSAAFLRDQEDVKAHQAAVASLNQVALSPDASVRLIADVIESMESP
ncbi:helix-turn-helix domain-containing protein [Saccharomonospora iraqiensis]|uniref:helix-turn-helix domain-containing protein n=1 Tax=Saccharomonospora iraqiensis TaxID=52698 RepID=UPI002D21C5B3|nr:helix-turn-helix transcriptional regulator [Saccharomonospora iraqiensis]